MTRFPRRFIAAASAGVLLLTFAGCTARGAEPVSESTHASPVHSIAIVTPEKESDHGWNQQGLRGAREVAKAEGIEVAEYPGVGYDNTETILRQVAGTGQDLIIAHAGGFTTTAARVAESTGTRALIVDEVKNKPGVVGSVLVAGEQGGYLAGVAAATASSTGVIGIVASADDLNWFSMAGGFAQGAHSVRPDIKIRIAYIGPADYGDSAGGRNVASQVIAAGADVIMGMGDGATVGYLQAVDTSPTPVRYIATVGDVSEAVTRPETVLGTVLWDFSGAYRDAIADITAGTFGTRSYTLDVAHSGLSLEPGSTADEATQAAVEKAKSAIVDGSVSVKRASTRAEVQVLLDAQK